MHINDELAQLENILEGGNYTLHIQSYNVKKHDSDASPESIVVSRFPDAEINDVKETDAESVEAIFRRDIFHTGDSSYGPSKITLKSDELEKSFETCLTQVKSWSKKAGSIFQFRFKSGHPAYPVWWDFAFLFRFEDRSVILIGSSSD